jgi:hypothetical protein
LQNKPSDSYGTVDDHGTMFVGFSSAWPEF